jgi:UDP-N-acetylmuramyl pentapeptide phosphotransferase/UDP-N-acetylglucosamine-1-phosphate transferase
VGDEKNMRVNPLQIGFSIIMGWIVFLVCNPVIQSIIHPGGDEMFWVILLLGLSLIGLGFIEKEKMISTRRAKTLLQIGVVLTIIWVIILIQAEGPYDLGLPKLYVPVGAHTRASIVVLMVLGLPVLGLILLAYGFVQNRIIKKKNLEDDY